MYKDEGQDCQGWGKDLVQGLKVFMNLEGLRMGLALEEAAVVNPLREDLGYPGRVLRLSHGCRHREGISVAWREQCTVLRCCQNGSQYPLPPSQTPKITAQLSLPASPPVNRNHGSFSNLSWFSCPPTYPGPSYRCPCWSEILPPVISPQLLFVNPSPLPTTLAPDQPAESTWTSATASDWVPPPPFFHSLLATRENTNMSLVTSSLPTPCPLTPSSASPLGAGVTLYLSFCSRHAVPRTHRIFPRV